jgi:hypothetical protein
MGETRTMPIEVRKPTAEEETRMRACPSWEKEPSQFRVNGDTEHREGSGGENHAGELT